MNHDPFAALAAADPARDVSLPASDVRRIVRAATTRSRRRRWILPTATIAVVCAVGIPGAAVASGYLARTGWFGSPNPGSPEGTRPVGTEGMQLGGQRLFATIGFAAALDCGRQRIERERKALAGGIDDTRFGH